MDILSIIVALVVAFVAVSAWRRHRSSRACRLAFGRIYASWNPLPKLEISSHYGYTAFTVLFQSKAEIEAAARAGLNAAFKEVVGQVCGSEGPKARPFDAELAVQFSYEGYAQELRARYSGAGSNKSDA